MTITPRQVSVLGGALFGAYTSDIFENPLTGIVSTGIGAATGAFLRLPQKSLRDLSKVVAGPKVEESHLFEKWVDSSIKSVFSQEDRDKLIGRIDNIHGNVSTLSNRINLKNERLNSLEVDVNRGATAFKERIPERVSRFEHKAFKKSLKLQSEQGRLEDKVRSNLAWSDTMVENYGRRLDARVDYLKNNKIPKAQDSFMIQQQYKFEKAVRNGFSIMDDMPNTRISLNNPKYAYSIKNGELRKPLVTDNHMLDSLSSWLSLDSNTKLRNDSITIGTNLADRRIKSNPEHYKRIAATRVATKIFDKEKRLREIEAQYSDQGISFENGRAWFDSKSVPSYVDVTDAQGNFVGSFERKSKEAKELYVENKRALALQNSNGIDSFAALGREWNKGNGGVADRLLNFKETYEIDGKKVSFEDVREGIIQEYNRESWYVDKATTTNSMLVREQERIRKNMIKGFALNNAAPSFLLNANLDGNTVGEVRANTLRNELMQHQSESLSLLNFSEEMSQLTEPHQRQQMIDEYRESIAPSYKAKTEEASFYEERAKIVRGQLEDLGVEVDNYKSDLDYIHNDMLETNKVHIEEQRGQITSSIQRLEGFSEEHQQKITDKINFLKERGVKTVHTSEDLVNFIQTSNNLELLQGLSKDGVNLHINDVKADTVRNLESIIKHDDLESLTNWFKDQLGNDALDAERKSNMFFKRFASESEVTLSEKAISFVDKADGRRVTIPLTSYKDGNRYHNAGNNVFNNVTQFNPYGAAYTAGGSHFIDGVQRPIVAADLLKGFDPEEMIQFIGEDQSLKSVEDRINSLFHYDSSESGIREVSSKFSPTSEGFIKSQGMLDFSHTLNYNIDGTVHPEYSMRNLTQGATETTGSERARLFTNLTHELPHNIASSLLDGVSMSALNVINRHGLKSMGLLAPKERNETGVGFRDTEIVNKNQLTSSLEDSMGSSRFRSQYKSSQVVNKLDVFDPTTFNKIASKMFGNDVVLADGGGFFNTELSKDFIIKDTSTIKVPLTSNMTIADKALAERLKKGDISKTNPQRVEGTLAYDKEGRAIGLNRAYSYGDVVDVFKTENDLRLITESFFDPSLEEKNMKFFSVASKSLNTGMGGNQFDALAEIAMLTNSGELKVKPDGTFSFGGKDITVGELKQHLYKSINQQKEEGSYRRYHLIGDADGTGALSIKKMIDNKSLTGTKIYDTLIANGISNEEATFTSMLLSESKSAIDLTTSVRVGIEQNAKEMRGELDSLLTASTYKLGGDNSELYLKLNEIVRKSGVLPDYLQGRGMTVGSINKGQSIVGTGNDARMSWNAILNLRASGFTDEDFKFFGEKNKDVLYETRSIIDERVTSNRSINQIIKGRESDFLNIITTPLDPEKRIDALRNRYGDSIDKVAGNPFITYNLSIDDHEIKSVNFSRITTNRSGFFEDKNGYKLLKQLDGKRLAIMNADLEYRDELNEEKRRLKKTALTKLLDDYVDLNKAIFSGDNNALKSSLSLISKHSDIMQIKGIGGEADQFAKELIEKKGGDSRRVWFISKEEAIEKAKQLEGDLKFKKTKYASILEPVIVKKSGEEIPLASMITREPAQGPMSSDLIQWHVDTTIMKQSKGNAYVPLSDIGYSKGMFGDMDQDTVQTLLGDFNTKKEYKDLEIKRSRIREAFNDMTDLLDAMKVKGSASTKKANPKSISDISSPEELADYYTKGGMKGRHRKVLAAPVTGLALAYTKALEFELQGADDKKMVQSRMLVHQLVENLIKTAHIETSSFNAEQEQAVEKLMRMRQGFLGKKGYTPVDSNTYEATLRTELPQFLNLEGIDVKTPAGASLKKKADNLLETVIKAEIKHSAKIGTNPFSPLDLPEHRFSKNSTDWMDALKNILNEQMGANHMDFEDAFTNPSKTIGKTSKAVSSMIMETLRDNKKVIGGGLAVMAGVSLLGRSEPTFNDSRRNSREYSASMLRAPSQSYEPIDKEVPMGMETNPTKAGYILPKAFNTKSIRVAGDFINNASESFSAENTEEQLYKVNQAVFGDGIRTARFQSN